MSSVTRAMTLLACGPTTEVAWKPRCGRIRRKGNAAAARMDKKRRPLVGRVGERQLPWEKKKAEVDGVLPLASHVCLASSSSRSEELSRMTLVKLRKMAKEMGIKGTWSLNKSGLVEKLVVHEKFDENAKHSAEMGNQVATSSLQESLTTFIPTSASELATWSVEELRDLAGKVGCKNHIYLRKAELIAELCAIRESSARAGSSEQNWVASESGSSGSATYDASNLEPLAENELFSVDPDLYSYLKESSTATMEGSSSSPQFSSSLSSGERLMSSMSGGDGSMLSHTSVIAVICGGPTEERGISLNSARSLLDHLKTDRIDIQTFYMDPQLRTYQLSNTQLYSNTPSDFDFKLLGDSEPFDTPRKLVEHLKTTVDCVFPMIHGEWGEDGQLQALLEELEIPYVGSDSSTCENTFHKFKACEQINSHGYQTIPSLEVDSVSLTDLPARVNTWLQDHAFDEESFFVIKPCLGGSSIGVDVVRGSDEAIMRLQQKLNLEGEKSYVLQPYMKGTEFTVNVIETSKGPIALMPTEIEMAGGAPKIFDFRKKYLPSLDVQMHTPPVSFSESITSLIMRQAEDLFEKLELRDFARFDGWYLSESEAARTLKKPVPFVFSDLNIIPGIEQNSFLFRQAACVGLSHSAVLNNVLKTAFGRQQMRFLEGRRIASSASAPGSHTIQKARKTKVFVLFGGETSERQVSLMSGLNTWLKLQMYEDLTVLPFMLAPTVVSRESRTEQFDDMLQHRNHLLEFGCPEEMLPEALQPQLVLNSGQQGGFPLDEWKVWRVPYPGMLFHTVEEVDKWCVDHSSDGVAANLSEIQVDGVGEGEGTLTSYFEDELSLQDSLFERLSEAEVLGLQKGKVKWKAPKKMNLSLFIEEVKDQDAIVFLAMHGGVGEDGTIQKLLEDAGVRFTGSSSSACNICMDKLLTADVISRLAAEGVKVAPKKTLFYNNLLSNAECGQCTEETWSGLVSQLDSNTFCIKPNADGCSTGVAKLNCPDDLKAYSQAVISNMPFIPANTLSEPHSLIPLMENGFSPLIIEPFIETADIQICRKDLEDSSDATAEESCEELRLNGDSRWIEVTVGLIGKQGQMKALQPSITVREYGSILTLEEKFQGGTGINLTPPPSEIVSGAAMKTAQMKLELTAASLGLSGFARIDAFMQVDTAEMIIIEVNAIPGLTPSTVLFQQAMAEDPPILPESFFRMLVDIAAESQPQC